MARTASAPSIHHAACMAFSYRKHRYPAHMEALAPTPDEAMAGLRMCKAVALADGDLAPGEAALLRAAASALGIGCSPEELRPATPEEVASALPSALLR